MSIPKLCDGIACGHGWLHYAWEHGSCPCCWLDPETCGCHITLYGLWQVCSVHHKIAEGDSTLMAVLAEFLVRGETAKTDVAGTHIEVSPLPGGGAIITHDNTNIPQFPVAQTRDEVYQQLGILFNHLGGWHT